MNKKAIVAVLASGGGSNAEEIFKYFRNHPHIAVTLLLTNNPQARVMERARHFDIPTVVFTKTEFSDPEKVISWLSERDVTHIVLAGFLWLIPDYLIRAFPDKIINIHPALLPKYGGKGMYGEKVHVAVKHAGDKSTGLTIHLVNENYDEGRILFQAECVIGEEDTPLDIAQKVLKLEHEFYPRVIERWILEKLPASGNPKSISAI
ncbi:MAG TPA: phosphoribosylglycinamide formyltransferase [Chryseolinea sp.]|nr:phosphoribosylglycinamide formyltransferase [Chryseolinea sp.]